MSTDLTFITNEQGQNLLKRFKVLVGGSTRFFDCLVAYFYTSGFYKLYPALENVEKVRILAGLRTDNETVAIIQKAQEQLSFTFSHAETKEHFEKAVVEELEHSEDSASVEEGIRKFIYWIQSGKLEIKIHPSHAIHAKVYIMTFAEGDRDKGRVITGSSNFTQAGLMDNLEFNVELKNRADYEFALQKFNELWKDAVAVDVTEKYVDTIKKKTWLNDTITPYELYLKFLYEYFKEKINIDSESVYREYLPENFLELDYQREAVLDAKARLEEYGGVFLSDVVGLGKTYISAMLALELDGRHLIIAPPLLLDKNNPGSWVNVFSDFRVHADYESLGKLDSLLERGVEKYKNIFIDESHRFRGESTPTYEKLAQICRGKRVILVTATPQNNTPQDVLSQIKLFQKGKNSVIPNVRDLEKFFNNLKKKLKGLDRQKDRDKYLSVVRENAKEIREKILKYIMVRRTRTEVTKFFKDDLKTRGLKFPEVTDPQAVFYEFSKEEDRVFMESLRHIVSFKYARYTPLLYLKEGIKQPVELAQINMATFMRILLIKRLESSFHAFLCTLGRFITSYEHFIREYEKGFVYISKEYSDKIFELLERDDDAEIQRLIEEDKAQKLPSKDFKADFKDALVHDLKSLRAMQNLWKAVKRDPKLEKFQKILTTDKRLKENKLIIFTESKETADYLGEHLKAKLGNPVLTFSGASSAAIRDNVIENFDARAREKKNDVRILITTDILSEGVNLHRSNTVINYDIPWNPTCLMQRVGRINRVDTKFKEISTYNFFPTVQSNEQIKLQEAAEAKIHAFIELLGSDARLLTDGEEVKSHDLFRRLTSRKTLTGEDEDEESELKYLQIIRDIRDKDTDLFEKIKRLPKKAKTARSSESPSNAVLTYFRKDKIQKFFLAGNKDSQELDFLSAAHVLEAKTDTKREPVPNDYYSYLEKNKKEFETATTEELLEPVRKGGRSNETTILHILKSKEIKHYKGFTDNDELYIKDVIRLLEEGALPKQTTKTLAKALDKTLSNGAIPLKILSCLKTLIAPQFFNETIAESSARTSRPREVILSEYLVSKKP